jgi:hypothetical protein
LSEADEVAKLQADISEVAAMRRDLAAELAEERRHEERVVRVSPPAGDREIEALLTGLMAEAFTEARRSFEMARGMSVAGQPVGMRDMHVSQGVRLSNAVAALSLALSRHKGKGERMVIEHRHHHEHRRIL